MSGYTSDNSLFTITGSFPLEILPGTPVDLTIRFNPTDAGWEEGTISLISDADDNPVIDVSAGGTGIPAPAIEVNQTGFTENMATQQIVTRNLIVSNTGGYPFSFSLAKEVPEGKAGGVDEFGHMYLDSDDHYILYTETAPYK